MPHEQPYTIFRTENIIRRDLDGNRKRDTLVSHYPGFGATPQKTLDEVMEDIAENEDDEVAETPMDDPDYDHLLNRAVENLSGTWEIFAGTHKTRPKTAPLLRIQ
jgi:hypothetical protein